MAGDRKIGVVAVDYYASARQLKKLHDELASAGAESFVCLVPRLSCLADTDDFNVVIVTDDDQAEPGRGEGEGSAHIVYAPERGQVGRRAAHVPERPLLEGVRLALARLPAAGAQIRGLCFGSVN